jgi:methionyl-tRNA formyltransferase
VRAVFFGTPEIAVPALIALSEIAEVVGVVCQPDRPAGRGLSLKEPAVKRAALSLGLDVHQPVKVKTGTLHEWLAERAPDFALVLAYGRILPAPVLAAPRRGCLNLHASLLPRYRGAAPIQWAIIRGESETGVSLMQMDEGLDTGPVYKERRVPILSEDDTETLSQKLAELAAVVVREDVPAAVRGDLVAKPQDSSLMTLAPPLTREHGVVDWLRSPTEIVNLVRGLAPRPGAQTRVRGHTLKILSAKVGPKSTDGGAPGRIVRADKGGVFVTAGDGIVELLRAQLEGRKPATGADLVNGRALALGDTLGT